jgi:hypothetical protein
VKFHFHSIPDADDELHTQRVDARAFATSHLFDSEKVVQNYNMQLPDCMLVLLVLLHNDNSLEPFHSVEHIDDIAYGQASSLMGGASAENLDHLLLAHDFSIRLCLLPLQ